MIAAIYARISKEQKGKKEEDRSPARQIENAKAFAVSHGWTTSAALTFEDDGISGAEFKRRPSFQRLMASLKPKPPFQILIVSEQKSLGREASETGYVIKQLAQAGVEIFEYVHGRSLTPKNAMDKVVGAITGFGDETHNQQTSERVHEAHLKLVKLGRVTGGRVFGYTNKDVLLGVDDHGREVRSHVERVINEPEAKVVRRIFKLYDSGEGLKRIAKTLMTTGAVCPKPFKRRDGLAAVAEWSPSTIRTILARELYHGVIVWNKSRKRPPTWGAIHQKPRPEADWVRAEAKHLQIVEEKLWLRVRARRQETEGRAARFESGRLSGRPPKTATHNLLAGLAMCGTCGGGLVVETSRRKGHRVPEYICNRARQNGMCTNKQHIRVEEMNEAVLQAVEQHALTPEAIDSVINLSERDDLRDQQIKIDREAADVDRRIGRLVAALETGTPLPSIVTKLQQLEAQKLALAAQASSLHPVPRLAPVVIENRLAEWRRLLRQSTTQGRTVLQRILRGRLTFTPRTNPISGLPDGYDFTADTRFDRLFTGIAAPRPRGLDATDRTGLDGIGPEDTGDADYGRLLDRVYVRKGVTSPTGKDPFFLVGSVTREQAA